MKKLKAAIDRIPTRLTKAGWWYVGAATLTSAAAYHSASNVLFLALAFFMSALLLNGLISWWNFSQLKFHHLRTVRTHAGEKCSVQFDLTDTKKAMHSLGLTAVIEVFTAQEAKPNRIKQIIRYRSSNNNRTTVSIPWTPSYRGWHTVKLLQIESYFPFGLLLKIFRQTLSVETLVWPAKVDVHRFSAIRAATQSSSEDNRTKSQQPFSDQSPDIASLRNYQHGDPIRSFNWKKTAQQRRPMVIEQSPLEAQSPELVRFDFSETHFLCEKDLHLYCSLIASWIEDEWNHHRWLKVALHHQQPVLVHNDSTFVHIMDQLAQIQPQLHPLPSQNSTEGLTVLSPNQLY